MKQYLHLLVVIVIALIFSTYACTQPKKQNLANNVRAVWNLTEQPCNSGLGNSMNRHPQEQDIKDSKIISIKDSGFKYFIPQLFDTKETIVKLFLNDKSRGVTDHYFLLSKQDLEVPFAAILVTELPPHMQNHEQAFNAVNSMQSKSAFRAGVKLNLTEFNGIYGKSLELILENRVGSHCFPTSDYQFLPDKYNGKTIGISRFSLIDKKLVEFSLIVEIPAKMKQKDAIEFAKTHMDSYWLSIKPIKPKE